MHDVKAYADEQYDGFRWSDEREAFIPECDCGEPMVRPTGSQLWECSVYSVTHGKLMLFTEDFPPFFGEED